MLIGLDVLHCPKFKFKYHIRDFKLKMDIISIFSLYHRIELDNSIATDIEIGFCLFVDKEWLAPTRHLNEYPLKRQTIQKGFVVC